MFPLSSVYHFKILLLNLYLINNNSYNHHNVLYILIHLSSLRNRDLPLAGLANHKSQCSLFHTSTVYEAKSKLQLLPARLNSVGCALIAVTCYGIVSSSTRISLWFSRFICSCCFAYLFGFASCSTCVVVHRQCAVRTCKIIILFSTTTVTWAKLARNGERGGNESSHRCVRLQKGARRPLP